MEQKSMPKKASRKVSFEQLKEAYMDKEATRRALNVATITHNTAMNKFINLLNRASSKTVKQLSIWEIKHHV